MKHGIKDYQTEEARGRGDGICLALVQRVVNTCSVEEERSYLVSMNWLHLSFKIQPYDEVVNLTRSSYFSLFL
jgi:hypothetical protein